MNLKQESLKIDLAKIILADFALVYDVDLYKGTKDEETNELRAIACHLNGEVEIAPSNLNFFAPVIFSRILNAKPLMKTNLHWLDLKVNIFLI